MIKKIRDKLEKLLFYSFIFLLPTQLGKHFWPDFSIVQGLRIDYLSPTIYLTDIVFILLILTTLLNNHRIIIKKALNYKIIVPFFLFTLLAFLNIYFSSRPLLAIYGITKLAEIVFLIGYISFFVKINQLKTIALTLAAGVCIESLIAIAQFINKGSLNNIFYFLGERSFSSTTPGIANANIQGELLLRPYATFPHPNVLAGYLTISLTIILFLVSKQRDKIAKALSISALLLGTITSLLSLSRVAILLWIIFSIYILIQKQKTKVKIILTSLLLSIMLIIFLATPLLPRFTSLGTNSESILIREKLLDSSVAMIKDNGNFGVGSYNFLVELPNYNSKLTLTPQPVHNIFIYLFAEYGLWISSIMLLFLVITIKKTIELQNDKKIQFKKLSLILIFEFILLGLFDHYLITLQQGQLLTGLILGISWMIIREDDTIQKKIWKEKQLSKTQSSNLPHVL